MATILLDSCVWGGALSALAELGHDVIWAGSWDQDPGDAAILAEAYISQRILVTLDKDFGELPIVKGLPHCGMIRLSGFKAIQMAAAIHQIIHAYEQELMAAAIITADPDRIRIRVA